MNDYFLQMTSLSISITKIEAFVKLQNMVEDAKNGKFIP